MAVCQLHRAHATRGLTQPARATHRYAQNRDVQQRHHQHCPRQYRPPTYVAASAAVSRRRAHSRATGREFFFSPIQQTSHHNTYPKRQHHGSTTKQPTTHAIRKICRIRTTRFDRSHMAEPCHYASTTVVFGGSTRRQPSVNRPDGSGTQTADVQNVGTDGLQRN